MDDDLKFRDRYCGDQFQFQIQIIHPPPTMKAKEKGSKQTLSTDTSRHTINRTDPPHHKHCTIFRTKPALSNTKQNREQNERLHGRR